MPLLYLRKLDIMFLTDANVRANMIDTALMKIQVRRSSLLRTTKECA